MELWKLSSCRYSRSADPSKQTIVPLNLNKYSLAAASHFNILLRNSALLSLSLKKKIQLLKCTQAIGTSSCIWSCANKFSKSDHKILNQSCLLAHRVGSPSIAAVILNANADLMHITHAASGIVVYCVMYKVTISTKYSFANDFLILEFLNDTRTRYWVAVSLFREKEKGIPYKSFNLLKNVSKFIQFVHGSHVLKKIKK